MSTARRQRYYVRSNKNENTKPLAPAMFLRHDGTLLLETSEHTNNIPVILQPYQNRNHAIFFSQLAAYEKIGKPFKLSELADVIEQANIALSFMHKYGIAGFNQHFYAFFQLYRRVCEPLNENETDWMNFSPN